MLNPLQLDLWKRTFQDTQNTHRVLLHLCMATGALGIPLPRVPLYLWCETCNTVFLSLFIFTAIHLLFTMPLFCPLPCLSPFNLLPLLPPPAVDQCLLHRWHGLGHKGEAHLCGREWAGLHLRHPWGVCGTEQHHASRREGNCVCVHVCVFVYACVRMCVRVCVCVCVLHVQ